MQGCCDVGERRAAIAGLLYFVIMPCVTSNMGSAGKRFMMIVAKAMRRIFKSA